MFNKIIFPFILTFLAGFSTLLGLIVIEFKENNKNKIICSSLSFAAGVMICVSITDLIPEEIKLLSSYTPFKIILLSFLSIIIGILASLFIEKIIPQKNTYNSDNSLYKVGIISMITIILHNIPEGIITFISTTTNTKLGISLAIAIAMHNIPEGISISVPIYYSTNSKKIAFKYTLISALSEPLGALLAFILLRKIINNIIIGLLLGIIAGIMLNISINELIPKSKKYNSNKLPYFWFIIGIVLMIINLIINN